MIREHNEVVGGKKFDGTVIDIETDGEFDDDFKGLRDSREYRQIKPITTFGYLTEGRLTILCTEKDDKSIEDLRLKISSLLDTLKRPFYAFIV